MSNTDKIHYILPTLTRRDGYNGRLIVYTLTDSSREAVEAYISDAIEMMKRLPPGQPLYTMHDISARSVSLTPHFRTRLNDIADYIREHNLSGSSAVILPNTFMNRIFALFAGSFSRRANMEQRLFTRLDDATRWMDKVITENESLLNR
jgi:hypothetical protein